MKSSSVSECCGVGTYKSPLGYQDRCNACKRECKSVPPQSGKSDSGIAWALKELGWDEPKYGWTHEKEVLNKLIKLAEQRGYEREKCEPK